MYVKQKVWNKINGTQWILFRFRTAEYRLIGIIQPRKIALFLPNTFCASKIKSAAF